MYFPKQRIWLIAGVGLTVEMLQFMQYLKGIPKLILLNISYGPLWVKKKKKQKTISAIALCDFTSPSLDNDIRDFFVILKGDFP